MAPKRWKDLRLRDSESWSDSLSLPTERVGRLSRNSTILSPPQILTHCKYKYRFIQLEIETHILHNEHILLYLLFIVPDKPQNYIVT